MQRRRRGIEPHRERNRHNDGSHDTDDTDTTDAAARFHTARYDTNHATRRHVASYPATHFGARNQ